MVFSFRWLFAFFRKRQTKLPQLRINLSITADRGLVLNSELNWFGHISLPPYCEPDLLFGYQPGGSFQPLHNYP
jgi:hypothetical protein